MASNSEQIRVRYPSKPRCNWGQWDIENIRVRVLNDRFAQIMYEKRGKNEPVYYENVRLNIFDKVKGLSLAIKTRRILYKLKLKLQLENRQQDKLDALSEQIIKKDGALQ